ncbi:MAG: MFS transporter [Methylobacteriaceae bacterium]|nr:MFS transporter [Methylobacteriaceae bacterium]
MVPLPPGQPVPTSLAWRTLFVLGVGAILGGLSMQAHLLDAADLAGALGLSADEASWIGTAGAAAEGAAVLAAAPLVAGFGVRRVAVGAAITTGALAAAGLARPDWLVAIRFAQGFACGLLPVVMMNWALRAFPPARRGLPLTLFAFASSFPTAVAALGTGLGTLHLGGQAVYAADLAWTPLVALAAYWLAPSEPVLLERFEANDWAGYAVLAAGVMLILVVLTQGERRFWLETPWMAPLLAAALVFLALATARLLAAGHPYLDLALLDRPTFAIGIAEALSLRFALLFASFAVPQALARFAGLRPEQTGETIVWLAAGQILGFPLCWAWNERRDGRWALALGLAAFALASLWASLIDSSWAGEQFRGPLIVAGFGQGFFLTSVLRFATDGIPPPSGATASGLFNLIRVLGTSGATAAVAYLLRIRENGHSARLVEGLTSANETGTARLDQLTQTYAAVTPDSGLASGQALAALAQTTTQQAYALAFGDVFLWIAGLLAVFALLVPALPRLPASVEAAALSSVPRTPE